MSEAERLNAVLKEHQPAAAACLSALGRRAAFPRGIPFQTAEARATEYNGTIGQFTDGHGAPMPLPAMADAILGLDAPMSFLYAPAEGHAALRKAWAERQRRRSLGSPAPLGTPMVVHGLTQGVALVADLFADPDTDVLIPDPCWENYELLFQFRPGANLIQYPFYRADGGGLDLEAFAAAVAGLKRKSVIVVNFPANPAGYTPTRAEAARIVDILLSAPGPAVVLFDDAYQGLVYEDDVPPRSLYWDVAERHDPSRLFPIKCDGATKELLFFGGRVAFLNSPATGEAEAALLSKLKCIARSTSGVGSGPAQALALRALQAPGLDESIQERVAVLARRYRILKDALAALPAESRLRPWPFNGGVFALIGLPSDLDAEVLRKRLIAEFSVGTISIPSVNAVRVAYCSVADDAIPELVRRLDLATR